MKFFAGVVFCGLALFCILREQIFVIRDDWYSLLGTIFLRFLIQVAEY